MQVKPGDAPREDDEDDAAACAHAQPAVRLPDPAVVERAAAIFRAAGDPARLALLAMLSGGERCVSELAEASGDAMSTVSQRLRVLRTEGMIRRRRDGKHIHYGLADDHVADLVRGVLEHADHTHDDPRPASRSSKRRKR